MIAVHIDIERTAAIKRLRFPVRTKHRARIPSSWAEMRTRHFGPVLRLLAVAASAKDEAVLMAASAVLFCRWCGIPDHLAESESLRDNQDHATLTARLLKSLKQPEPFLRRCLHLHGPGRRLRNLCFRQFITVERVHREWLDSADPKLELAMIALTWRPPLIPWRPWMSTLAMKWMRFLPENRRARMLCTYLSQRTHMRDLYPELHQGGGGGEKPPRIDQVILSMAGAELGSYHSVAYQPVHRVLELMQMREIQFRKNNPKHGHSNLSVEELHEAARRKLDRSQSA